ncbi:TPR repeat protein [Fimbriiglobus ruber]|uniref:TPR repeat protein n=1 Tax=Fimbriiglobus ruber TaxID=1908690 RepID=A0A225D4Z5_9BACT|nr:TPR repeat protein [Fimbriiglobus ruber]
MQEAAAIYQLVLAREPNQPDALHLLGVVSHQQGDHTAAVNLIGKALSQRPSVAAYHCNLGEALRGLGRLAEAEASCRTALNLQPVYPEASHNLGVILFRQRRWSDAETNLRAALQSRPDFVPSLAALADTLREQGRISDALNNYQRALEIAPDRMEAHANLGLLLVNCGEFDRGLWHCRQAVELKADSVIARHNLGHVLLEYGRIDEALDELAEALNRDKNSVPLCVSIGQAWFELGDYRQAGSWFERAVTLDPSRTDARCHLAAIMVEAGNPEAGAEVYRQILADKPESVDAHAGLARVRLDQGDVDGAVAAHREAIRLRPMAAGLHAALGNTLSTAGDILGAVACFRTAIEYNPNSIPALSGLNTTLRGDALDDDINRSEALLAAPWMTDGRRASLRFGLAQAYDGRGDYARAAEHMVAANALQKKHREERDKGYSAGAHSRNVDRLIAAFTPEYFEQVRGWGRDTDRPVFVVGMPRSGTTLTEQILSSHPAVFGAGERPFVDLGFSILPQALQTQGPPADCLTYVTRAAIERIADWHLDKLRELDGGRARFVVDKMPDNYQLLGWIVTLFPRAKIIHCRRDVRDVALSCWLTHFSRIRWASDLIDLADRVNDYLRLAEHYHRVLPITVFELDYEQMVGDQEVTTRRLLDFVGLDWDPACLQFHKTERLVRTASVSQVRQPIYRRSVDRWKRYEAMLEPFLNRLRSQSSNGIDG